LSAVINCSQDEIIHCHIENDLLKDYSQISLYSTSLDLELDKKEILHQSFDKLVLQPFVEHKTNEDVLLLINKDEYIHLERKPFLIFDPDKKSKNEGKEFDTMRALDSFLNTEGGVLIIGTDDNKKILGLSGDYSLLGGDRNNFDKFQNYLRNQIQNKYFRNSIVGELIEIKRYEINAADICIIDIRQSPVPVFVFHPNDGQLFYVRQGDRSIKLEGLELSYYLERHFCAISFI
jgi:predicted HTH transcriptional regulator